MTIKKGVNLLLLCSIIISTTLSCILGISFLIKKLDDTSKEYLRNAYRNAERIIQNRVDLLSNSVEILSSNEEYKNDFQQGDYSRILKGVSNLEKQADYVDLIAIYDKNFKLVYSNIPLVHPEKLISERYKKEVRLRKKTIATLINNDINNLFEKDTAKYNEYIVKKPNDTEEDCLFEKVLMGIAVAPVMQNQEEICGYIIASDMINNDEYYDTTYSNSIENSYLSISIDGIRINTNIDNENSISIIGSKNPIAENELYKSGYGILMDRISKLYYGKVKIKGVTHLFIDGIIKDFRNEEVCVIGVGIHEEKYKQFISQGINIAVILFIIFIGAFFIINQFMVDKLMGPIQKAVRYINDLTQGKRDIVIDDKHSETSESGQLLTNIGLLALQLKQNEEREEEYKRELEFHQEQLEEKVKIRTQYLQEAMKELEDRSKAQNQFLGSISHELRTPLSAIISAAEAISEKVFGPINATQEKHLHLIENNGKYLLRLINNVLDTVKLESGTFKLHKQSIMANELLENCMTDLSSLVIKKKINMLLQVEPLTTVLYVDLLKFTQCMVNIIHNAIKFSPEGGTIYIKCTAHEDGHVISVSDEGVGIKKENLRRILEPFEQEDNSLTKEYQGTGLGLAIAKEIIELHEGMIEIKSEVGVGTQVIIVIPKEKKEETE